MPLFYCNKCHHEWEYHGTGSKCDWCGGVGHVLEKETPFEKFCKMLKQTDFLKKFFNTKDQ